MLNILIGQNFLSNQKMTSYAKIVVAEKRGTKSRVYNKDRVCNDFKATRRTYQSLAQSCILSETMLRSCASLSTY